ncbi:MAG TPA: YceI family protein [Chloroflexia bacterium]|nr:YceI family protein [Chloroflexia bacterium]
MATTYPPTTNRVITRTLWQIDPTHSSIEFTVRHMMITNVHGTLGPVTGTLEIDEDNLANSRVHAEIDVTQLNTGNEDRDKHLRSEEFFDVEKYPTITFESTEIEWLRQNTYCLVGDLTVRGTTRKVELTMDFEGRGTDPWRNSRLGFSASTVINRKEFGLTWNVALETGGVLVGEDVKIRINISAIKAQEQGSTGRA